MAIRADYALSVMIHLFVCAMNSVTMLKSFNFTSLNFLDCFDFHFTFNFGCSQKRYEYLEVEEILYILENILLKEL